jgi:predicted PurR-regulated permease PerM
VNKGLTGIKFVNINLKDSEDYDILSPKEVYIGSVDSDDYETAEFKVYVKGFEDSTLKLPLAMEYMDANNNPYQKDLELEFTVYSAKKLGASSGSSLGTIIFILIILVIAYFIYRRWEKKKRKVK